MGNSKKALYVAEKYQNTASTQPKWRCQNQGRVWGLPTCEFTSLSPQFGGSWHQIPDFQTLGWNKGCYYSQHSRKDKLRVCVVLLTPVRTVRGEARTVRQGGVAQMDAAHAGGLHHSWELKLREPESLITGCKQTCPNIASEGDIVFIIAIVVVQLLSRGWLFAIPWTAARQASLSFTINWSLLKFKSIESVMPSDDLNLCHPLLPLPSIFPSFRVFSMSRLFTSGGQTIGASASASVLPMNSPGQFPLGLIGLISFMSKGPSRVFSNTTVRKHQFFSAQSSLWADSHIHTWLLEKQFWLDRPLLEKWCLCFLNTLSRFVIAFLRRSSIF